MAEPELTRFCRQVRSRSQENRKAVGLLHENGLTGSILAVLRQELDSLIRCIYLLSVRNRPYRERLIRDSVNGALWRTEEGERITDRRMLDLSVRLFGWTKEVYEIGCGFIHLS
jgi:hypothetical protein